MARRSDKSLQPATAAGGALAWPTGWILAGIGFLTLLAYLPALRAGFIWDDDGHVTRQDLRSIAGLIRIWLEPGATQQYYPVLHSAFWLEFKLWGNSPFGYHLLNILLHAAASTLFGLVLRRLAVPGAWFAALLFALHPVCVESVAWISEQKNTLSAVFYLASALAYLRFDQERRQSSYALASAFFGLALLTKTVTASLPAALLVVFWWQRGRLSWRRDLVPLLPWFLLGAGSGLYTAHFERTLIGAQGAEFSLGVIERGVLAGRIIWFYLGSLVWPAGLVFTYPRWTIDLGVWWQWIFPLGALGLLGGLVWWRHKSRAPLAALLLFTGTLFPVLGFFNVYPFIFSFVADHFQYLAGLAIFALAAAALAALPRPFLLPARVALLAVLGSLTFDQTEMYRDSDTLYRAVLRANPTSWMAHNNLAISLANAGQVEEAIPHLQAALELRPDFPQALNNLGDDLTRLGRAREAIPHLERALVLQPRFFQAHNTLGQALLAENRITEAIGHFEQAIRLSPSYAEAEKNLGLALARNDRTQDAIAHFQRAALLKPDYADAELAWGIALMLTNRFPEAVPHFERAISLAPESVEFRSTYGRALVQAGRYADAILHYEAAVRLDPENAELQMTLARGLRQVGRLQEAGEHYEHAIQLNPALAGQR